ncbi:MAG: hypothetical protein QM704_06825 [Anaeromyxobacteraceae bacterium]
MLALAADSLAMLGVIAAIAASWAGAIALVALAYASATTGLRVAVARVRRPRLAREAAAWTAAPGLAAAK